MRPDNTAPIIAAARHRHELTRARAIQAIRELDHAGNLVTFASIAGQAGISRSWLYSQPDIRAEITRLRDATSRSGPAPIPASQRASDASLLRRLEAAHAERTRLLEERTQLREENARLRRQLAAALGEQRQAGRLPAANLTRYHPITIRPLILDPRPCRRHVQVTVLDASAQVSATTDRPAQDNLLLHHPEESHLAQRLRQPGRTRPHPACVRGPLQPDRPAVQLEVHRRRPSPAPRQDQRP